MSGIPGTALVLSGGGARGAFQVGVLQGIVEALELGPDDDPPFDAFVGTSAGAINAAFLAGHAHLGDLDVHRLASIWRSLRVRDHLNVDLVRLWRMTRSRQGGMLPGDGLLQRPAGSLLDSAALREIVEGAMDWDRLHDNVQTGKVRGVIVPALELRTGHTVMFAEVGPEVEWIPSRDPHRDGRLVQLTPDHVLASAAIPIVFPPVSVGGSWFYDGGLRFNTPLSPAIRLGLDRLMLISTLRDDTSGASAIETPNLGLLVGKLLNAVLLDPIAHDMQVLQRYNRLLATLEETLDPEQMEKVQRVLEADRGARMRVLQTLSLAPTADLGRMAAYYLREGLDHMGLDLLTRWAMRSVLGPDDSEADWAGFITLDGSLAGLYVDHGRAVAASRAQEIREFFGRG